MAVKNLVAGLCICFLAGIAQAQDSAVYEDEIERQRKILFNKDSSGLTGLERRERDRKKKPRVVLKNPFDYWYRKPLEQTPRASFHADASITGRNIDLLRRGKELEYKPFSAAADFFLGLPPPPVPPPIVSTNTTFIPSPTVNINHFYTPLLTFLQAGPGGSVITLNHLIQVTPSLMNLVSVLGPSTSFSQILNTPQGIQLLSVAQSILQPLGMWNTASLNAWIAFMSPPPPGSQQPNRSVQIQQILLTLHGQLVQASVIPPPTQQTTTTITQPPGINQIEVIAELNRIWKRGNKGEIATKFIPLFHSITKHVGFEKGQGLISATRKLSFTKGNYQIGITLERRYGDSREIHVINPEGYFVNDSASGAGRYYQGLDDISLVYLPFKVHGNDITTLDVVASDRYALLKRMAGGNVNLLDRASTHSTALLNLDIAFTDDRDIHLRFVAGGTPYSSVGGVMGKIEYGDGDYFTGHLSGGILFEDILFDASANYLGYLETENTIRTPYLEYVDEKTNNGIRAWATTTLAISGLASLPTSAPQRSLFSTFNTDTGKITNKRKKLSAELGLQGELRLIPELHAQLGNSYALIGVYGGVTTAIVPGGKIDLDHPERTLGLRQIRYHIGSNIKLRLSKMLEKSGEQAIDSLFLEFRTVAEFSLNSRKSRTGLKLSYFSAAIEFLAETEHYLDSSFTDVRLGGSISYRGIYVTGLKSIKDGDYRLQAGVDVIALID